MVRADATSRDARRGDMTARSLVVGWDGADLDLVQALGSTALPHLHAAMARGAFARSESVRPPATLPNWTTFLTGLDPGRHGVFDFTVREGYGVRFAGGRVREAPTWIARLDRLGRPCACVGFPGTHPPERLAHGVFVSGWDSPVAFRADASFVWPPRLHAAMSARFGPLRFDDVDEFDADAPGWHARLAPALIDRVARKAALGEWLLGLREWDVFAIYFGESDTAAHHLWAHHDPTSPRHPNGADAAAAGGLAAVYRALDEALGALLAAAGGPERVELTVVSDHGSGGTSTAVLHPNRALAALGWLAFRPPGRAQRLLRAAKDAALTRLPPAGRERLFRLGGGVLPSWLESRNRFGAVDFARTVAFSEELHYFPAVWLNVRGRDPEGTVAPGDAWRVGEEVAASLRALRDPAGAPVVREVWRREALFEGPFVARAPDLLLELEPVDGFARCVLPSGGPGPAFRTLAAAEHLGRKGRSLPGSHRAHGLWIAAGPRVAPVGEVQATIADAAATTLARADAAVPPEASGRVLWEALLDAGAASPLPDAPVPRAPARRDDARVERRLRALGYLD